MTEEGINKLSYKVIGSALNVHRSLGPGFVEKIYQRALYIDLQELNPVFEREKKLNLRYKNASLGYQKVDFIIENRLIVELKSVTEINDIHKAQMISYLKASKCQLGLILNFAKPILDIKRIINT